jgi:hypothetical protein
MRSWCHYIILPTGYRYIILPTAHRGPIMMRPWCGPRFPGKTLEKPTFTFVLSSRLILLLYILQRHWRRAENMTSKWQRQSWYTNTETLFSQNHQIVNGKYYIWLKRKKCQYSTCKIWFILNARPILANTVPCSLLDTSTEFRYDRNEII